MCKLIFYFMKYIDTINTQFHLFFSECADIFQLRFFHSLCGIFHFIYETMYYRISHTTLILPVTWVTLFFNGIDMQFIF